MTFWTRRRWRLTIVVLGLAAAAYAAQVWAELTTHPDSETWHVWAIAARTVFIAAAIIGTLVVLRPDELQAESLAGGGPRQGPR